MTALTNTEANEGRHPKLLIVDDEPSILTALGRALRRQPYDVLTTESPLDGLSLLENEDVGVVISDYMMPEMDGIAFLANVKERWPNVQRIMLTGQADEAAIEGVINKSAVFRFLAKPWDKQALLLTISDSFVQHRVMRENERLWELTQRQNQELKELNRGLEEKIGRRTRQLSRAKLEWERTFDAIVDPVAIVNESYDVVRANLAYGDHGNVEIQQVPGRKCYELVAGRNSPCDGCPLPKAILGEMPRGVDVPARGERILHVWAYPLRTSKTSEPPSKSVPPGPLDVTTTDIPFGRTGVCYYRDVTEERALANKLARTEKLASLGLFVGGVAHEINNPLGGILAFTQILLRTDPDEQELKDTLTDIESGALRCKRIIDSLQSFAHGSTHVRTELHDFSSLINDAVAAFERDYHSRDKVRLSVEMPKQAMQIRADGALIHQLFRNLLQNALHAVAKTEDAAISVRATLVADEPLVQIAVNDNGAGIPEDKLTNIFDPFFTTKGEKEGTGLGLSICHRIVEKHDGHIEVNSKVGEGTTFLIELPVVTAPTRGGDFDASGQ